MSLVSSEAVALVAQYGYGVVAAAVAIESIGIPFPGETVLIGAAIYAGTTHRLQIGWVIAAAVLGAVVGDNIGFWIGRDLGYPVMLRYGRFVRLTEPRIKLGQYLFLRHGGKVVFFGRFIALLRTLAAFLAGANRMPWERFLVFNVLGGVVWAGCYGIGAYWLGRAFHRLLGPAGLVLLAAFIVAVIGGLFLLRRHEKMLEERAERALPGPLAPARHPPRRLRGSAR